MFIIVKNGRFLKKAFRSIELAINYLHTKYDDLTDDLYDQDYSKCVNQSTCVRHLTADEGNVDIYIHKFDLS
jgi:hypothetical protein